ncbi:MAG: hypothetical protein MUF31_10990 [Akkermansiaceae bacterium]|jgi:hypothetical protein|nr:hypothetical protein [Akkermansiaceae bacterium]
MKSRSFIKLPLIHAAISGLAGWVSYPALLALVTAPIQQTFVLRMPSEMFFHQLQTAGAFSMLGFLIPTSALLIGGLKSDPKLRKRIVLLATLSLLIAISTSWMMHASLSSLSEALVGTEARNPGVPSQSHYSMIPLHRIATYPGYVLIVVTVFNLLKACRCKEKKDNMAEMATPRNPPSQIAR